MARPSTDFPLRCLIILLLATHYAITTGYYVPQGAYSSSGSGNSAADILKASINETADPCKDFFEFACGRWVANHPIPQDKTSIGRFELLATKVNDDMKALFAEPAAPSPSTAINTVHQVFDACMDTEAINAAKSRPLLEALAKINFNPPCSGYFDLTSLLIGIDASQPGGALFSVSAAPDEKNVSRLLLHFDQGDLGLGDGSREYYLNEQQHQPQLAAYEQLIVDLNKLVGEDAKSMPNVGGWLSQVVASGHQMSDEELHASARKTIDFEKRLAEVMTPETERRNYTSMYNLLRLSDMQALMPAINWHAYFAALMPADMLDYLDSNPEVIVVEPAFFQRLQRLFDESDGWDLVNYIFWRYLQSWSGQLDERYSNVQQTFSQTLTGQQQKQPRWKRCIGAATSLMPYASGALYVRRYFDEQNLRMAKSMVDALKQAFIGMLFDNDWMEEKTRELAIEKAVEMLSLVGYPDITTNDTALDEQYANFTLHPTDGYADIISKFNRWSMAVAFHQLLKPVDYWDFGISPATVNAFYSSTKNAIIIPAAILQSPFFDRSFPKAVNYGGIGSIIGHEITHGFDDQGSQFDQQGNLKNWWDPATQRKFFNRTQCIVDQYSRFEVPGTGGQHINGVLTQGENIADNGGIQEAYRAYHDSLLAGGEEPPLPGLEHYSNDQIFFLSFAQNWCGSSTPQTAARYLLVDPHSPVRFRVNGVVANQPEFASAFQCPVGSPMNSGKSCDVW